MAAAYRLGGTTERIPEIDALRGISILLVYVGHAGLGWIIPGGFGVSVFFVVSGFVITRMLLAENERQGRIDLGDFYARRALRLYPALLTFIVLSCAALPMLGIEFRGQDVASALFYWANYQNLMGFASALGSVPHPFSPLWSLAVEEHFYILFPCILLLTLRRGFLLTMMVVILASLSWRLAVALSCGTATTGFMCLGGASAHNYYATDARFDAILWGCVLAWLTNRWRAPQAPGILGSAWSIPLGLTLIVASLLYRDPFFRDTLRYTAQGLGIALAVCGVLYSRHYGWLRDLLRAPWLLLIGRMSYVIYLMHFLAVCIASAVAPTGPPNGVQPLAWYLVFVPVSVLLSAAVYWSIERPAARWRHTRRPVALAG